MMAALLIAASLSTGVAAAFPIHGTPTTAYSVIACAGGLVGAMYVILALTVRSGVLLVHLGVLCSIAGLALLEAVANIPGQLTATTVAFTVIAMYVAYFLPWRTAVLYLVLVILALNMGMQATNVYVPFASRVRISLCIAGVGIVLGLVMGRLQRLATTDQLTGLLNRAGLGERATHLLPRCARQGIPLTVCMVDLDEFKDVNDDVGHVIADRMLVELTSAWRALLPSPHLIARYGGDEFLMVMYDTDGEGASRLLEGLRKVSVLDWSAGVVTVAPGETLEQAHERADIELYRNKVARQTARRNAPRRSHWVFGSPEADAPQDEGSALLDLGEDHPGTKDQVGGRLVEHLETVAPRLHPGHPAHPVSDGVAGLLEALAGLLEIGHGEADLPQPLALLAQLPGGA
jgi:diguanylate cyclase (GGDEF)-like protein